MSAPDNYQSEALVEIMKMFGWNRFALLASLNEYGQLNYKKYGT